MSNAWEIVDGPTEYDRPGAADETAWLWSIAASAAERGTIVVAVTGTAVIQIEGGEAEIAERLREAYDSKGLTEVQRCLREGIRPRVVVIDSTGACHFEDHSGNATP